MLSSSLTSSKMSATGASSWSSCRAANSLTKSWRKSSSPSKKHVRLPKVSSAPSYIVIHKVSCTETSSPKTFCYTQRRSASPLLRLLTSVLRGFSKRTRWPARPVEHQVTLLQRFSCRCLTAKSAITGASVLSLSFCSQEHHLFTRKTTLLCSSKLRHASMISMLRPGRMSRLKARTSCRGFWLLILRRA